MKQINIRNLSKNEDISNSIDRFKRVARRINVTQPRLIEMLQTKSLYQVEQEWEFKHGKTTTFIAPISPVDKHDKSKHFSSDLIHKVNKVIVKQENLTKLHLYGDKAQVIQTIEELSELQHALCRYLNNRPHNVKEEIADSLNMIQQMIFLFEINDADLLQLQFKKLTIKKRRSKCRKQKNVQS